MRPLHMVGVALGLVAFAHGDGMFMGTALIDERASGKTAVASTEQKGVIIELPEGREALLLQTTYHGPSDKFAWVIPVPGRPAKEDVFLAEPAFIDVLLKETAPEVKTTITDPRHRGMAGERMQKMEAGAPPGPGGEGAMPGAVTVYERFDIGSFEATVLSATQPNALTEWLRENGYRVPEDSADVLGHYVRKQWYFVALKMQPAKAAGQPVLDDVDPVGIRFATDNLVYPLHISRASSRQKTGLLLFVLSAKPVACDQLPEATLPIEKRFPKGSAYAAIRKEAVDSAAPALVTEYRSPHGMPYPDLYYEKDAWAPREGKKWSATGLWAARQWTLLDREKMEDLTFSSSPDKAATRLLIQRTGELHVSLRQRAAETPSTNFWLYVVGSAALYLFVAWLTNAGFRLNRTGIGTGVIGGLGLVAALMIAGLLGALLLVFAAALCLIGCALRETRPGQSDEPRLAARDLLSGMVVAAGMGGLGYVVLRLFAFGSEFHYSDFGEQITDLLAGDARIATTLLVAVALAVWLASVAFFLRVNLKAAGARAAWMAVPAFVMGVLLVWTEARGDHLGGLLWGLPAWFDAVVSGRALLAWVLTGEALLCLLALVALVSFLAAAPWVAPRQWRRVQPLTLTFVSLALIAAASGVVAMARAHAGMSGYVATGSRELDQALQQIDGMMTSFHDTYGCYPEELEDLTASAVPKWGVDSSGNAVEPVSRMGYAGGDRELPVDPLTGRRDTWVYEPTGNPMVDSGGFEITLSNGGNLTPDRTGMGNPMSPDSYLDAQRHQTGRYWIPEGTPEPPFQHRAIDDPRAIRLGAGRGTLSKLIPTDRGLRIALAAPSAGVAEVGDRRQDIGTFAWAPDHAQYVFTERDEHPARVWRCAIEQIPKAKSLTRRPWDAEVIDLAWHPRAEKWAAIARRPEDGPDKARAYLIGPEGGAQPFGPPGRYSAVEFAPSGRALLAIAGPSASRGRLRYVPLDGSPPREIADGVVAQPFETSALGCLAIRAHTGGDVSLLLIDPQDRIRELPLPVTPATVVDTWLGADEVLIALDSHTAKIGEVWSYLLEERRWRRLAQWELLKPGTHSRTGEIVILGRAPQTRPGGHEVQPFVLAHPDGDYQVYAVSEYRQHPSVQLLARPEWAAHIRPDTPPVSLDGKQFTVRVGGVYWPNAFKPGDLVVMDVTETDPRSAEKVAKRDRAHLTVGGRQIGLWNGDPILIRRNASRDFLRKLTPQ
jgi:hypothetical protein